MKRGWASIQKERDLESWMNKQAIFYAKHTAWHCQTPSRIDDLLLSDQIFFTFEIERQN